MRQAAAKMVFPDEALTCTTSSGQQHLAPMPPGRRALHSGVVVLCRRYCRREDVGFEEAPACEGWSKWAGETTDRASRHELVRERHPRRRARIAACVGQEVQEVQAGVGGEIRRNSPWGNVFFRRRLGAIAGFCRCSRQMLQRRLLLNELLRGRQVNQTIRLKINQSSNTSSS
jgi:hypothetical protein